MNVNAFVGPRPHRAGEPFFGRDREIPELADLLVAFRVVVLHGPGVSGRPH